MAELGCEPVAIDALFICTCTGYLCPGLSSHVAEQLGLRGEVFLADMVGLGCGAAIPTLRAAQGFLAQQPDAIVLVVAVEVCSAAFFINDDPGVLISLCLFGDGASASLWSGGTAPSQAWEMGHFRTIHRPEYREHIRFVNENGMLKNRLDRCVPALAADAVGLLYGQRHHHQVQCLTHGGGRDVLDALENELGLPLVTSRQVLEKHGNMSSPSILFALEAHLSGNAEAQRLWLSSFGAGFAAHSCEMWRAD
jgi:alkylresorcinol/alkylpyrone synthase